MGERGPVPKRDAERLGHHGDRGTTRARSGSRHPIEPPPARPTWHVIVRNLYNSVAVSGMTQFYEASDWGLLFVFCEDLDRQLKPKVVGVDRATGRPIRSETPVPPATMAALLKLATGLGLTEGDRRRMSVELTRREAEAEEDAHILRLVSDQEREAFGG